MSDTGRKRSRKTKLVPRDFSDLIDEESFLQERPLKIPCLDDDEASGSGLEFSVKVEVEDIDSLPEEDSSNYMKYLFSLSQESTLKTYKNKKTNNVDKVFIMNTKKMVKKFHGLHRKYPQEPEAVMHTRNSWGKVFHERPVEEPSIHPQDEALQKIFLQWRNLITISRNRDTPFCYKCYVCDVAWWSLTDFRSHIRCHDDCTIFFELDKQECNIVAFLGSKPQPKSLDIDGKCFKCAKTIAQHEESKNGQDKYTCRHCKQQYYTCRWLIKHEGTCDRNPVRAAMASETENKLTDHICKICDTTFLTLPEKLEHLNVCHRVRSDEPIATYGKLCRVCNRLYHIYNYHVCTAKNLVHECMHCQGKFQNKHMLDAHLALWDRPFKCNVCDKFVMRQCMGPEHYARHSSQFLMMYRCLPCKKLKLFYSEEAFHSHRTRTHKVLDSRRPSYDRIIVPKIMLEECELTLKEKRSRVTTVRTAPKKAVTIGAPKERRKTNSTDNQDNRKSIATESKPIVNESSPSEPIDSKDLLKTLDQITETLDIKPDIIVKEEKLSDTEDSKADLVKAIEEMEKIEPVVPKVEIPLAVREQSDKFKQIIQEVQEIKLSTVLQANSEPEMVVKKEIKEEPEELEDLIIIDSSSDSIKQETEPSDLILNLEPEIILKAGYKKRKVYKCNKCPYQGYHKEYREHMNNMCKTPTKRKQTFCSENFKCTKCNNYYDTLKSYALHFVEHKYKYLTCPQCGTEYDSVTKLLAHLNIHIKNQYVRMQIIDEAVSDQKCKVFQCKTCKEVIDQKSLFVHWEDHLKLKSEPEKKTVAVPEKVCVRGEHALDPDVLKRILDVLQQQDKLDKHDKTQVQKVKTCFVCNRHFDRRNDCKRHLVEHLLDDAYASVNFTGFLKCQICGDALMKPDAYKKHMRDHASLPIYQCGICNKTFSDSSNFTKHKKVHNLKAYVCDVCNKKFQAKISLEKHVVLHMSTDPYRCDHCSRVFYDRSFYRRHIRQHHDRPQARFRCMICKDRFESLRLKWDHMWEVHKHRKDKADCPLCKKSFRKISDVKKHTQTEHGFNISLANVFELVDQYQQECRNKVDQPPEPESSDDDVLLIEEERETLVIYDD